MPDANQTKLQKAHSCNAFDVKAMSLDFAPYTSDSPLQKKLKLKTVRREYRRLCKGCGCSRTCN